MWVRVAAFVAFVSSLALGFGPGLASANPAADNLQLAGQSCADDGSVGVSLTWTAYGVGPQQFDLSVSPNFPSDPSQTMSHGPFDSSRNYDTWSGLQPGVTYYGRVDVMTGGGWLTSQTLQFTAQACSTSTQVVVAQPTGTAPIITTVVQTDTVVVTEHHHHGHGHRFTPPPPFEHHNH